MVANLASDKRRDGRESSHKFFIFNGLRQEDGAYRAFGTVYALAGWQKEAIPTHSPQKYIEDRAMEILVSIAIGSLIGGLACLMTRFRQASGMGTLAVAVLGALLGLATHTGLGGEGLIEFPGCEYFASSIGAMLALVLWSVALRLFLAPPDPAA